MPPRSSMTSTRLRECLHSLAWSQISLGRHLNYGRDTSRKWARGLLPIPQDVASWLEKTDDFFRLNPLPSFPSPSPEGSSMTPERFKYCLDTLHWTQRLFAQRLGRSEGNIRQWAYGRVTIPNDVASWLEKAASFMEDNPPPLKEKPRDS